MLAERRRWILDNGNKPELNMVIIIKCKKSSSLPNEIEERQIFKNTIYSWRNFHTKINGWQSRILKIWKINERTNNLDIYV